MSLPRVVYTPVRLLLPGGWDAVVPDPAGPPARRTGEMRWRLLSANNRQLGRAAGTYPDLPSARSAVEDLTAGIASGLVVVELGYGGRSHGWAWTVSLCDEARAVSGRGYERAALAVHALALFSAQLPLAVATPAR